MNIKQTKNLETEYKDEFMKGFTLREIGFIGLSLLTMGGIAALLTMLTGWEVDTCVYMGIPAAFPICFIGFKKIQGLTVIEYLKEVIFMHRTRDLTFDADELPEHNSYFSMECYEVRMGKEKKGEKSK